MKPIFIVAGAALLGLAGAAIAQPADGWRLARDAEMSRQQAVERSAQRFDRLDIDNDGRLTLEEARQTRLHMRQHRGDRAFDRLDLDNDGNVTRAEFDQTRNSLRRRQAARGDATARPNYGASGARSLRRADGLRAMRIGRLFRDQGYVSREQFEQRALTRFDRLDRDHDGVVTMAERRLAFELRRDNRGDRPAED